MAFHKRDHAERIAKAGHHADPNHGAQPVEDLEATVRETGDARHRRQQCAHKRQETAGQQRQQAVAIEHAGGAVMVFRR